MIIYNQKMQRQPHIHAQQKQRLQQAVRNKKKNNFILFSPNFVWCLYFQYLLRIVSLFVSLNYI